MVDEYEQIPLEGISPSIAYVYHRKGSRMYKLYCNGCNMAIYQDPYLFAVFPAYKNRYDWVLKAFMDQYIPGTPLTVNDFCAGCSKGYFVSQGKPIPIK